MAHIISADSIKQTLPGYDPAKSELFHHESARLADKEFMLTIKSHNEKTVVLLAGGAASGKTEYVSEYLNGRKLIVFDGTLPSFEGAQIKIKNTLKLGKNVEVHFVLPKSLVVAFVAFLNRDRKFAVEHFYRTHSYSRNSVLQIAKLYEQVAIKVFESDVDLVGAEQTMKFEEITFPNRDSLIEYLKRNQYTEVEIRNRVIHS